MLTAEHILATMNTLKPFFGYFGGKWRLAKKYPEPRYENIIEPFAGSAGYSLRHFNKKVTLIEKNPVIAGIWDYLINADPQRILSLPDAEDITNGTTAVERNLAGMWFAKAPTGPRKGPSSWMRNGEYTGSSWWGDKIKRRIAEQVPLIRHWKVINGGFESAPDIEATWFIDPPYITAGKAYPNGSKDIDYESLSAWCRARRGQSVVCEAVGASWMDFHPMTGVQARLRKESSHREAVCLI